jgi:hypothetical protein
MSSSKRIRGFIFDTTVNKHAQSDKDKKSIDVFFLLSHSYPSDRNELKYNDVTKECCSTDGNRYQTTAINYPYGRK